jgi:gliding motility-associated lipoprotein GldD
MVCLCFACQEIRVPKPKAFLSLEYPKANYQNIETQLPFTFEKNKLTTVETISKNHKILGLNLNYPSLNATVYLTYKKLNNNLKNYITEAQVITQNHAKIAREVSERAFENKQTNVYGKLYNLKGAVASPIQFFISDNKSNFLLGALYFKTRPNYDSIFPAVDYIKKDIVQLMESVRWKNQP